MRDSGWAGGGTDNGYDVGIEGCGEGVGKTGEECAGGGTRIE